MRLYGETYSKINGKLLRAADNGYWVLFKQEDEERFVPKWIINELNPKKKSENIFEFSIATWYLIRFHLMENPKTQQEAV